ncbi:MAG: FtsW/RodA/SpoVE family cell cycle protein, partial [Ornithinimicrobium sp.]
MSVSTVTAVRSPTGRLTELFLLLFAVGIVVLAYVNVGLATSGTIPANLVAQSVGFVVITLAFHVVIRWKAQYADPLLLPIATLLNGLGLVMIHRIDIGQGRELAEGVATRQLMWSALAMLLAAGALFVIRDHRILRRYTYLAMVTGFVLLLLPMLPIIGYSENGSRLWIRVAGLTFQPGEIAKIALIIFFAGYLVQTRDALSLVGTRIMGLQLPRGRDLGPILAAWGLSAVILIAQRDLGSSLLFFGLFVAMLYLATERISWVIIGLTLFAAGSYLAWMLFAHVQTRVDLWLDPFKPGLSDQVAKGLMGMAHGGIFGTGLGEGYPQETYFANSDYIMASFGE